jgi:F-type H+-transporting ATPase subunit g
MSLSASRAVLRQSKWTGRTARRFESTISKAPDAVKQPASKASQTVVDYKSKASEGLSRVTSSAGPAITGAARSVGNTLGRIGGRTGTLIAFIESEQILNDIPDASCRYWNSMANDKSLGRIPPAIYYTRVGLELSKLVFQGQKMAPPYV